MAGQQEFETPQAALAHYGKKGMRWGVRKDDDPASEGSTRSEKKQEKREAKIANLTARAAKADIRTAELDKQIAETPKGIRNMTVRNDLNNQRAANANYSKNLKKSAEAVSEGRLTVNQKRLIIGGGLAAVAVLGVYGSTKVESGEFNSLKLRGQAAIKRKTSIFNKNPEFANAKTPDELSAVMKGLNPGYDTPGGQMNCRRCTFTYELRRRGYDVTATTSSMGWGQSETGLLNALTPGKRNVSRADSLSQNVSRGKGIRNLVAGDRREKIGDRTTVSDAKDRLSFINAFKDQPSGARGESVFNFGLFGHSLAYEKVGDKVFIFDTQKGKRYDTSNENEYNSFLAKWGMGRVKEVEITRLDNVDLDEKFLSRWATNQKKPNRNAERKAEAARVYAKETTRIEAAYNKRRAREQKAQAEANRQARAHRQVVRGRPEFMDLKTWNALRKEAGLT